MCSGATGITAYLEAGGTLENAQAMAAHESPRTTKLYDRTGDEITLDEVERITIQSEIILPGRTAAAAPPTTDIDTSTSQSRTGAWGRHLMALARWPSFLDTHRPWSVE